MTKDRDFQRRLDRVEALVSILEECPDLATRERARELVRTLLDLHAMGIARMLELAGTNKGDWARDGLVSSLLLLHGLHPAPVAERVRNAVTNLTPRLRASGVDVELLEASEPQARIRLRGDPAEVTHARATLEAALLEAAPDIGSVAFEESCKPAGNRWPLPLTRARA